MTPISEMIDEAAEADAALQALADAYPDYAAADVARMEAALSALEAAGGRDSARICAIFGAAHDIKGQGSVFGYDLMTLLGEELCFFTRDRERLDAAAMVRVRALVDACQAVLAARLTGDGGAYGARLSANLGLTLRAA